MNELDICMGGRVAEEIIFGANEVTTGRFTLYPPIQDCQINKNLETTLVMEKMSQARSSYYW